MNNEVRERLTEKGILPDDEMGMAHITEIATWGPEEQAAMMAYHLTPEDFAAFSAVLGLNIQTKEELLKRVKLMTTVNVEGVEITLDPRLLNRLKSRAVRQNFPDFLRDVVRKQLFSFAAY